jgi:hypothetical protein
VLPAAGSVAVPTLQVLYAPVKENGVKLKGYHVIFSRNGFAEAKLAAMSLRKVRAELRDFLERSNFQYRWA